MACQDSQSTWNIRSLLRVAQCTLTVPKFQNTSLKQLCSLGRIASVLKRLGLLFRFLAFSLLERQTPMSPADERVQ